MRWQALEEEESLEAHTMTKPADNSNRPSLYGSDKGAKPTAYSVLDAATVQGLPRRRPPLPEPKPSFRKQRWLIALALLGVAGIGAAWWLQAQNAPQPTLVESGNITAAAQPAPARPAAPTAAPAAPATAVASAAPSTLPADAVPSAPADKADHAALVEQLEAPSEPTSPDPLKILEADHSKDPDEAPKAHAKQAAKVASAKPAPHLKPATHAAAGAKEAAKHKNSNDTDVELMQAVLANMPAASPSQQPKR